MGGTLPGRVISISLDESGALGIEVEKRKNSEKTAIISRVITGSQAERAGLQRGDIVCHVGGQEGRTNLRHPRVRFLFSDEACRVKEQ